MSAISQNAVIPARPWPSACTARIPFRLDCLDWFSGRSQCELSNEVRYKVVEDLNSVQAWLALDPQRCRALLPAPWADLALVSGRVLIFYFFCV